MKTLYRLSLQSKLLMHNRRDSLGKIGEDKPTHDEKTINIPVAAAEQQIYIYIYIALGDHSSLIL